ncbi:MAG: PssD/Cps14F family polysaccharide biosynthesis glycosyltransferase [Candidatus Thorarchaeota archaeon]
MKKKKILFVSSSGGHLFQLLQLSPLMKKYNSVIITENKKVNDSMLKGLKKYYLFYGGRNYPLIYIFKFFGNIILSIFYFILIRPSILITTGAHTAIPLCYISKLFRKKIIFIETFAKLKTPTISGKLVYPIADVFLIQWPDLKEVYPKAKYLGGIY